MYSIFRANNKHTSRRIHFISRLVKQHCQNRYGYLIRVPTLSLDKMCGVTLLRKHKMGKMNNQISWMQWVTHECCHTMLYKLKIGKSYFETLSTDSAEDFIEYLSVRFNYLNHVSLCFCISWSREVYFFVKQSSSGSHRFVSTFQFVNIK